MRTTIMMLTLLMVISKATPGQHPEKGKHLNLEDGNLALSGYDPVAYFKENKAVKGKESIATEFNGVKYLFSDVLHKNQFLQSPTSYQPQYGGWCAYAMGAKGEKVEVDPETFKVVEGKLYLFYNRFFNNTLDTWNKDEGRLKTNADKNWNKLIGP